ncbi:MAG: hypothetical protein K5765_07035 [Clostridia bacterium]|nr:hypothetical protein [Clostridia bacterium]
MNITVKEYIRRKALGLLGLIDSEIDPRVREDRLTFVNNINEVLKDKLKEYNVWYAGDADELLNFYTRANVIDYNTDPLYNRNKKSYFWAVSSTENDIKRSHSGQPRNIVDTLVDIIGLPQIFVGSAELEKISKRLKDILDENNFDHLLMQKSRPLTFVEGWGGWKINWDTGISDNPILLYYRADAVDFIFRNSRLIAIIYKDYYQNEKGQNFLLFETRRIEKREIVDDKTGLKSCVPCLIIEKELFKITGQSEVLQKMKLSDLPQLKDTQESIIVTNFNSFLGWPNIYYADNHDDVYGRSIFTGKIDLFDDLDQCFSQASNTVRRSTTIEYFNTQYLEKDEKTGMPRMPKAFDRKYIGYKGGRTGDGTLDSGGPVQAVQPRLDFVSYSQEEQNILVNILSGIMSPATLGIDVAKRDNASAQREKEKVTIFTRNTVIYEETKIFKKIANDLLVAWELMHTGKITCKDYDVSVQYEEFADASFESKLETVLTGWQSGILSDETALRYLHGDRLDKQMFDKELEFVKKQREKSENMGGGDSLFGSNPEDQGPFGALGAENEYNDLMEKPRISDAKEDLGVPELTNYDKIHNRGNNRG